MQPARLVVAFGMVAALSLGALPAIEAKPAPVYYEKTIVTDTDDDYASNGALDVVGVDVSERYSYNPETQKGHNSVYFRIEVKSISDVGKVPPVVDPASATATSTAEYYVGMKIGGAARVFNATVTVTCKVTVPSTSTGGPECGAAETARPNTVAVGANSLILNVDADALGLKPGTSLTDIYAASSILDANGQKVFQDLAPKDNQNAPEGAGPLAPTKFGGPYTLVGTYPFMTLDSYTPLERFAVPGGTATYTVRLKIVDGVSNDRVALNFATPAGWSVEAPLGTEFGVTKGGQVFPYEFSVRVSTGAGVGDMGTVTLDAVLVGAGGHVVVPTMTMITGPKTEYPEFSFEFAGATPKVGTATVLPFLIKKDGQPLNRFGVKVDLLQAKKKVATVDAEYKADGRYEAPYTFETGGAWTADVYVAELSPSPHAEYPVKVAEKKKGLPGFEPVLAVLALALVATLRRR